MQLLFTWLYACLLTLCLIGPAQAAIVWDESSDGDLSGDPAAPTIIDLQPGSNMITGSMSSPNDTRDFITFTIEANETLTALLQLQYEDLNVGGPGNRGYHAINAGNTSFIPGGGTANNFLGGSHLDSLPASTDMLPVLASAPQNGTGFTVPLGPGNYSYVIQQTGPQLTGYSLDFVVTAVPLPAAAWLFGSALLGLGLIKRRKA